MLVKLIKVKSRNVIYPEQNRQIALYKILLQNLQKKILISMVRQQIKMFLQKKTDIKAAFSSSSSKDESLGKHTQNFVHKSTDKSSYSERNKLSDTTMSIRLKKHHSDSRRSIDPLNDDVFVEHKKKKKSKIEVQQELSLVKTKTKLIDTLQECSNESKNDTFSESNISPLRNTIISESKIQTYPKAKIDNLTDENQVVSILEKYIQTHDLKLVEHIDTALCLTSINKNIHNQTKINLESKNSQTHSSIKINSKAIKRKINSESLDRNKSPIKVRTENKMNMLVDKVMTNNIEISDYKMLSDNELVHTKQKRKSIAKYMIRKKENYKLLKQKREQHRKERIQKIKNIRKKLFKYFRSSEPNTSESEEEQAILLNYLKRRKQQFADPFYDITEEDIEDIFKKDKLIHDTSVDNLQKDIENTIPAFCISKRKSDNLCDSIISIENCTIYDAIDKKIEDEASIYKHSISIDNSQENIGSIDCNNSCDSTTSTEKYSDVIIDKEIEDEALIYEHDISVDDSQKNVESAIPVEVQFKNLCDSTTSTEKYIMHDATANEKLNNEVLIYDISANKSQENIKYAIAVEVKSDNSCDSIANTEEHHVMHDATTEKKKNEALIYIPDVSPNNLQKNVESAISVEIKSNNSRNSTTSTDYNIMHNATTEKEIEDGVSLYKHGMLDNNSQKNTKSAILVDIKLDNSNDSIACIEKNYAMNDATRDKEVEDKPSIYKCPISNNSREKIKNKITAKAQYVENSSLIVDIENNKNDARAKSSKAITSDSIEIDLNENINVENIRLNQNAKKKDTAYAEAEKVNIQVAHVNRQKDQEEVLNVENVDLAQCKSMQNLAISNLELPITFAYESALCEIDEKDVSQNVENLLLTNNNITKDGKTIDQLSMASTSETSSSEKRHDEFLSIQTTNSSTFSSNSNYCDDNYSSNNHSADNNNDDDNNSDIEIEIKIKPKLKYRVSRKFSLKGPWSAVNTCIKNLHTLKDPSFLNNFFQKDHKTSKRSKYRSNKSLKNNTSLNNNESVTVETDTIYDSSPTTKDNVNDSQPQQNFQDYPILNENRNTIDGNQKGRDKCTQSVNAMTTETSPELNKFASDLGKQLQKASTDDKQKKGEQNFPNNTTLEKARNMAEHSQEKKNKCVSFIEQKETQMATENNFESVKPVCACDVLNVGEQLSRTSSDATYSKVRIRSIAELNCQYSVKSTTLSKNVHCQSVLPESVPTQSPLQSAFPRSTPSQPIPFQFVPSQLRSLQSTPSQLVPPQLASPQSVSEQLPSYNTAVRHVYFSSRANAPVASVEINTPNIQSNLTNVIEITVKRICNNIEYCRNLIRYKVLEMHIQKMCISIKQTNQDLLTLNEYLRLNDIESVITYVNKYMLLNKPVTMMEFNYYNDIVKFYMFCGTQTLEQNNAKSNASQHPNIGGSLIPNASIPNTNTQSFSRNAPFPDAKVPNRDIQILEQNNAKSNASQHPNIDGSSISNASIPNTNVPFLRDALLPDTRLPNRGRSTQSSIMPRPVPTIANVNQQQLFSNSVNFPQKPHSRQSTSNIRQQYRGYVPSTAHSRIHVPNTNQQQSLKNMSHSVQGQYVPSANILNIGMQQQIFVNTINVSSSNSNMASFTGPVNQKNVSISPATNMRQSHMMLKNSINSTATASAVNAQQQKQMYSQTSQINSDIITYPMANQTIASGIYQTGHNVILSGFFMANSDAPRTAIENVRQKGTNVNQRQASCNQQVSQASSERSQYNCYSNSNDRYYKNMQQTQQQKLHKSKRLMVSKDTSCSMNLTTNDISQNMPQNVPNKRAEIPKSQSIDRMQKEAPSTNRQQNLCQEIPSTCNVSQNISSTAPKTSTLLTTDISQNTSSKVFSQKDSAVLILPKSTPAVLQTNEVVYRFNLAILTDIQKILLRDQIRSYFLMSDQLQYSLNEQEFERMYHERMILICLFDDLYNCINNIITKSQTKKCVEKDSQANASQNRLILQENTRQISEDKLTKTQSKRDNENSRTYNRNLEKQFSKQSIDLNISKNLKPMAKNDLEARNKSRFTPGLITIEKLLTKDTRLQEQNNDVLKKEFRKSSLIDMKKQPESTEISLKHSRILEETSATEVSAKNSETEAQDNVKINESLKTASSYDKKLPELGSLLQRTPLNLLEDASTKKTKDQSKIAKNNEKSNNMEKENIHETFNVATFNSRKENDVTSQSPYNAENQNKEVYNANNEILSENLHSGRCNDVDENIEILNSTEIQSNPLNTSRDSIPASSNNISISPIKECESMEISQMHVAHKEYAETVTECLNAQQDDSMDESNNSTGETYNETSDSSGKLYIDESEEESQKQEECDKVLSSKEDNLSMLQDSAFDMITCNSTELMPSCLKNVIEVTDISQDFVIESQNAETLTEESLETKKTLLQEMSFEDEWNIIENTIQSINIIKEPEKGDSMQSLLEEEIECEEMSLKFEVLEDALSTEESEMQSVQSIYPKFPEDMKKMEIDIYNDTQMDNEQLKYVSEQKYYEKSRTSSCNSVEKNDFVDAHIEEVFSKNGILNANIECSSVKSVFETTNISSILNVRSISPSLFEKMKNMDTSLQSNVESLNEKDEKSMDMIDNLRIPDKIDEKPCLRCKRESTVYCEDCLEAYYCSKRCSLLHWKAEHHKKCNRNAIMCIDIV